MYPVVLVHGFLGYERFFCWRMFTNVASALQERGIEVLQPQLHPTRGVVCRATALAEAIDQAFGRKQRVHIIAHSLGGLDSRYLASPAGLARGDRICSVTTLSTPHFGTPLAPRIPRWLQLLFASGAKLLAYLPVPEQERAFLRLIAEDNWEALVELAPGAWRESFNEQIVDSEHTRYLSYAASIETPNGDFIALVRRWVVSKLGVFSMAHDGIVSVDSAVWGDFRGVLPCDHGTLIGLRIIPFLQSSFDHLNFMLRLVDELAQIE